MLAIAIFPCSGYALSTKSEGETVRIDMMRAFAMMNAMGPAFGWGPGQMAARASVVFKDGNLHYAARTEKGKGATVESVVAALKQVSTYSASESADVARVLAANGIETDTHHVVIVDLAVSPMDCADLCITHKAVFEAVAEKMDDSVIVHVALSEQPARVETQ